MRIFFLSLLSFGILQAENTELQKHYFLNCSTQSDINEHLPILHDLALDCESVVEVGIRGVVSTWAALAGLAENPYHSPSYLGIDLVDPPLQTLRLIESLAAKSNIDFQFLRGNDLEVDFDQTDLLFIDSLHTYAHLTYELEKFSPKVRKYIALHDTSAPWGDRDDTEYHGDFSEYPPHIDRGKQGLWPAVTDFLATHPEWSLQKRYFNNHGLTVLRRNSLSDLNKKKRDAVTKALNEKIILCTGPAYHQKKRLVDITQRDQALIPFKKIFLTTNDAACKDVLFGGQKPVVEEIEARGHQLDCLNCMISTIKNVISDPDCKGDDIILFKHESVFINDMHLVRGAVETILNGYDMVIRYYVPGHFLMADVFMVSVKAARHAFGDVPLLTTFGDNYQFCEDFLTKVILPKIPNMYRIDYSHLTRRETELGFYHITPPGEENWPGYWDMANYHQLYK